MAEIVGAVGSFLGGLTIKVVNWAAAPIVREFDYLCCFTGNINALRDGAGILETETTQLRRRAGAEENNGQVIFGEVEGWLENSDSMKTETDGILVEALNFKSGWSKFRERYSISKKAKKTAIAVNELLEKSKFDELSYPPPIAGTSLLVSSEKVHNFESRRQIEVEIMKSLEDKSVKRIGICGMGGVGKTTLAQEVMNRALEKGLFDEVVMAVVGQSMDKINVQLQIAEPLGLELVDQTLIPRACKIRDRLMGKKRALIILDDVWESINFMELGIPCEPDSKGCTIILTSRNGDVLKAMNVKKARELKILDREEAWFLFKDKAGTCVDDAELKPTAEGVMRECDGLPLALTVVGVALKDEIRLPIWKDALRQLRRGNPADIPDFIDKVYKPLKLSNDRLGDENQNAKSLFLLCCLFRENSDIPLEHLTYFAMGLHLFEDVWELEEVRDRMLALIKTLKTRGLLLDGYDEVHVRMHDVVRDVSIFIALKEKLVKCSNCTWISSHVGGGARLVSQEASRFPKLKLLFMNDKVEEQEMETNYEDKLIGGSRKLNVLFIEYGLLQSLPSHITKSLKMSLTTLVLRHCESLESIAVVGQFDSLKVLICQYCPLVKEVPEQVGGLRKLKLLKISRCLNLERVAAKVVPSLVGLEELKIVDSFGNWKGREIEEGEGASLREIESLKKLRCLEIEVSAVALAAQPLHLSSKLVQFRVRFGASYDDDVESYLKQMSLHFGFGNDINWGDLSENVFLTLTECLSALGWRQDFNLNLASAQSIKWLTLEGFENKKNITSAAAAFPLLEFLSLGDLENLEEMWDDAPIPSNSFYNLKHLRLVGLRVLKRMGKSVLSSAKDFFLRLESIEIRHCDDMEHLVLVPNEEEEHDEGDGITLSLPKLKTLFLTDLPELRSVICSKGIQSIQFPAVSNGDQMLQQFEMFSFGNLQSLILDRMECKDVWCDQVPVAFFNGLVELHISYCWKITSLFASSKTAQNLVNLQKLRIDRCWEMVKVIEDDDTTVHSLFPRLQHLTLSFLDKLESFCEWGCTLELPALKNLDIDDCHEMKSFNAGGSLVITPVLQAIKIGYQTLESVDDLNGGLSRHFEEAKIKRQEEEGEDEDEEEEEGGNEGHQREGEVEEFSRIITSLSFSEDQQRRSEIQELSHLSTSSSF